MTYGFGYDKLKLKGLKFYCPYLVSFGQKRHARKLHPSATEAQSYTQRLAERMQRYADATTKGKVSIDHSQEHR